MVVEFISKQKCSDAMDMIIKMHRILDQYQDQRNRSDYFIQINHIINNLDCSARIKINIKKAFAGADIKTIGDLMSFTKSDICKFRNIGTKSLDVIFKLMDDISIGKFLQ